MNKNILFNVITQLLKVLKKYNISLVLMGGIATSILARPRATFDIDAITAASEEKLKKILPELKRKGFKFDKKHPIKMIHGLPFLTLYHFQFKTYIDLFIAFTEFQKKIVRRANQIVYENIDIKIISPEDLILIKLQSGREKDMEDVRELIIENRNKLDFRYLKTWAENLNIGIFLEDELKSLFVKNG